MEHSRYRLLFTGEVRAEVGVEAAKKRLAATFRLDPAKLETLFVGGPVVIKRAVDYPTARKFFQAFEAAGAVCRIEPVAGSEVAPSPVRGAGRAAEKVPPVPLGGFWLRPAAFGFDLFLLGAFCTFLGAYQFDFLAHLGAWGRLFGFGIALLYFGLLNSSLGQGQTLGKKIARIRVVDRKGGLISPARSFLRFAVLGTPYFLNGASLPTRFAPLPLAASMVVFGVGGALIYLYLANRRTRQSLHDLCVGTFVVRSQAKRDFRAPRVWRGHLWVTAVGVVAVVVVVAVGPATLFPHPPPALAALQRRIDMVPGTRAASVLTGKNWGSGGEKTFLSVAVEVSDPSRSITAIASEIATLVMVRYPDYRKSDRLIVTVRYGYDIGLASSWQRYVFNYSPRQWRERLRVRSL